MPSQVDFPRKGYLSSGVQKYMIQNFYTIRERVQHSHSLRGRVMMKYQLQFAANTITITISHSDE